MMAASALPQDTFPGTNSPHHSINRAFSASSADSSLHRRAKTYDPNTFDTNDNHHQHRHQGSTDESNSIPLTTIRYAQQSATSTVSANGVRLNRSRSLFRRPSKHIPAHVYTQGTVPPVPQTPILQHTGRAASPLLRLDDAILIRISRKFDLDQLLSFSHISKRCREITAKTLTLILQRTVLKATLCQERKAVFSLEFIFQHLDPASFSAVFRASQLKSRRYFENSALARPVVQALTLVTPHGAHHPIFRLAGFESFQYQNNDGTMTESMTERDLERATTLLGRPFELDIKDKGYYRVSPTTACMVDTPFFPSQPLLDPLVPIVMEGATHGPPSWEMMYKVDLLPPNYPQRVQQQQEKIYQERVRQAALNGKNPPPPPVSTLPTNRGGSTNNNKGSSPTPTSGFVPLPAINKGPNLQSIMPDTGSGPDSKSGSNLKRKPTVVRPPPEGWGPLPPMAPPPTVPASLAYQLGTRTVNPGGGGDPTSPTYGGGGGGGGGPMSPTFANAAPSCLEPELAEETERFLTLLFLQFPVQTLFPLTAAEANRKTAGGVSGWMAKSKLGRSLTQKKTHRTGESVDYGK
ncbi:hypothetical protein BG011_007558 [Mortierella polycephala]|uniref:F-box domain-containing protein n=1 Tax=Mortierella polycephala TaxID=41804 RepID=A0A9P6PT20_9FUNG|nr:hypothetical protein BG011_007558 [Mortierella polycephala]